MNIKVKQLKWEDWTGRENDFRAVSLVGFYTIRPTTKDGFQVRLWVPGVPYNDAAYCVTVDDAKAAAQSDFERRILSALETPANPIEEVVDDQR